jgi:ribosome biogenesis GTPase A
MNTQISDRRLDDLKRSFATALLKLQDLTKQRKMEKELLILQEAFTMMNNPYQFEVVGEVKSGKSSFISALLGEGVCKVDARPCTDTVQEIVFGEQEEVELCGKYLTRISRPIELLKTVAVVDTPGTNTVIENHQVITESYIPHSDLVIFVFPAKNPHTKTAWDLLSFVKDQWKRKVIFVLQQADLEPEHLSTQKESVRTYALQHRVPDPVIFATSAKFELDGKRESSGFEDIRDFIRAKVTGGKHLYEKLEGQVATASRICEIAEKSLAADRGQLEMDKEIQGRIQNRLTCGAGRSSKEIDALVDRLVTKYDSIAGEFKREFREGLEIGTILKRILPRTESMKKWLADLQKRFEERFTTKLNEIAKQEAELFVENIRTLIREILNDLDTITKPKEAFNSAERLDKRRTEVTESVQGKLRELAQNVDMILKGLSSSTNNLPATLVVGGAVAVIGAIILHAAHVAFVDITGGVLTAVALSIAGITLLFKRGRIIDQFERGLDKGKEQFHQELKEKLAVDLRVVYSEIEKIFQGFFDYLQLREQELKPQIALLDGVKADLLRLDAEVRR